MIIELIKANWYGCYLSSNGNVYRIVPTDPPPGYAREFNLLPDFRCFRLERIEDPNELLDAMAWLCSNRLWSNIHFHKTKVRDLYFVYKEGTLYY